MSVHVYGIPSCTTVRKSLKWLDSRNVGYEYTPFAKVPDLAAALRTWIDSAGQDRVMNARAATFRALPQPEQERMKSDVDFAIARMVADPRLIKRPVLVAGTTVATGFDEAEWRDAI